MSNSKLPSLKIGNRTVRLPIIQGGMGVRVSRAVLAAAVAAQGAIGIIATPGIGKFEEFPNADFTRVNDLALRREIQKAKSNSKDGLIGVNVLVALTDYEKLVTAAVEEKADIIISGAGLPLNLPELAKGSDTLLVPVVSSARTLRIICKKWKRAGRLPDAVIVEGPRAGGHLGYRFEELMTENEQKLEDILPEVIKEAQSYSPQIPVIAAGGIYDGADIARMLVLGASGVQMATRFVCTNECDVHINFKKAYLAAGPNDITLIKSPVGMPGKVIRNAFVNQIKAGKTVPFKCRYRCLKTCDPKTAPYCIARVLAYAAEGQMDCAFAFAGSNACKCNEIIPVKELIAKIQNEYANATLKAT